MQPAANVSRTDMPDNEFQEKRIGKVDKKRSLPIYNIIITLSLYIYISHFSACKNGRNDVTFHDLMYLPCAKSAPVREQSFVDPLIH